MVSWVYAFTSLPPADWLDSLVYTLFSSKQPEAQCGHVQSTVLIKDVPPFAPDSSPKNALYPHHKHWRLIPASYFHSYLPVIPHKVVAEVSKMRNHREGQLLRRMPDRTHWWTERWLELCGPSLDWSVCLSSLPSLFLFLFLCSFSVSLSLSLSLSPSPSPDQCGPELREGWHERDAIVADLHRIERKHLARTRL